MARLIYIWCKLCWNLRHKHKVGNNIQLGNAGIITATSFSGNNVVANHFVNVGL